MTEISWSAVYEAYDQVLQEKNSKIAAELRERSDFERFIEERQKHAKSADGFQRMQTCRDALNLLDGRGWNRSFHQRLFHDQFIRACARVFFKTDGPGAFARAHQTILEMNAWESLCQQVLISTPRRFGKTISVSMFAAAMIFSCPNIEVSIYSTCKRISQKLLRNVQKFLHLIYEASNTVPMREIRSNMEEVVLQGPCCNTDVRIVNSYPSKVSFDICG